MEKLLHILLLTDDMQEHSVILKRGNAAGNFGCPMNLADLTRKMKMELLLFSIQLNVKPKVTLILSLSFSFAARFNFRTKFTFAWQTTSKSQRVQCCNIFFSSNRVFKWPNTVFKCLCLIHHYFTFKLFMLWRPFFARIKVNHRNFGQGVHCCHGNGAG